MQQIFQHFLFKFFLFLFMAWNEKGLLSYTHAAHFLPIGEKNFFFQLSSSECTHIYTQYNIKRYNNDKVFCLLVVVLIIFFTLHTMMVIKPYQLTRYNEKRWKVFSTSDCLPKIIILVFRSKQKMSSR